MKRLSVYLHDYRRESLLAPFFKLLEALMDLLVPLIVATIINEGINRHDTTIINKCFLALLVLAFLGMAFSFTAQYFAARAAAGFAAEVREALFKHIQTFSYRELDEVSADTLITRLTSDVNQMQNGLNLALRLLLRSPFIVFGALIMALRIDAGEAVIFAVSIVLLLLVVYLIMLKSIPLFAKVQIALDKLMARTRENLSGVRVIRAFVKEESEIADFQRQNREVRELNLQTGRLSALLNPLTYVIVDLATIVLIYTGAIKVSHGSLSQGEVVALYNYMAQIIVELIKLASLTITINRSLACAGRVSEVLAIEPSLVYGEHNTETEDSPYRVEFDQVSFTYEGTAEEAISDISFKVKKGRRVGIIGATGSGKSTIISLIARFYDPDQGEVKIDGTPVNEYSRTELLNKVAVVPQKAVLFSGTIKDNLKWGNESAGEEEIHEALRIAQALDIVGSRIKGLESEVEAGGRNFSGGQRQRLCIARALLKKPEILLLDDAASALDLLSDKRLRQALAEIQDMDLFIVSQRVFAIKDCDLILVMDDGRLVGQGSHDDLLKECEVYQEICASQQETDHEG